METESKVSQLYYEVGGELLDKTNTLTSLLECEGNVPTLLFCNSKADADVVDVVLKKRGITVLKPATELPNAARIAAMKQVQNREVTVVAVTDSTGRGIDNEHFELVINYSVPSEPEVYLHRVEPAGASCKLRKVITLVGPQDQSNFQFIKKVVGLEFAQGQPPSAQDLSAAKFKSLVAEAVKLNAIANDGMSELVKLVLDNPDRDKVLALLIHNTLTVIPGLKKTEAPARQARSYDNYDGGDDRRGGGGDDRRGRDNRGRDGDRRGGFRRDDRGGNWGDRDRGDRGSDRGDFEGGGSNQFGDSDSFSDRPQSDRRPRREDMPPPIVESRFYVGQGARDGFTKDTLSKLVSEQCGLAADSIKRFSLRERYAFFDVGNDVAEQVSAKLGDSDIGGGKKLFLKKATVISIRSDRQENSAPEVNEGSASNGSQEETAAQPTQE